MIRRLVAFSLIFCFVSSSMAQSATLPAPRRLPTPQASAPPPAPAPPAISGPVLHALPGAATIEAWSEDFGLAPVQSAVPTNAVQLSAPIPTASVPIPTASASIGEVITEGAVAEPAPLQTEVTRWYQYPWRWMTQGWSNHAEFGLDGTQGNADTLSIQTGLEMKRKTDAYTLAIDIDYRQASANGLTTADNGRMNIDYDRMMGESSWTTFGKFGLEFDEFKVFDLRVNVNGGLGYYWLRNDKTNLISRFGTGASKEIGAPDDDWKQEAVFGLEADHQLSARQKIKAKVDYFPEWAEFSNFRLVADVAWESLLDGTDNLSIRLSATDRYDSTPQGALANDIYYSALLLYKF